MVYLNRYTHGPWFFFNPYGPGKSSEDHVNRVGEPRGNNPTLMVIRPADEGGTTHPFL